MWREFRDGCGKTGEFRQAQTLSQTEIMVIDFTLINVGFKRNPIRDAQLAKRAQWSTWGLYGSHGVLCNSTYHKCRLAKGC